MNKKVLPFSPAVKRGNLIFTSGQIHLTPEGKLLQSTISEQTHQIMKNLEKVLQAQGACFRDVVKTTIYMTDMTFYKEINEAYATYFEKNFPARVAVCVKELPLGARIEISMIAYKK